MYLITEQPAKPVIPVTERRNKKQNNKQEEHSPSTSHTDSPSNTIVEDLDNVKDP